MEEISKPEEGGLNEQFVDKVAKRALRMSRGNHPYAELDESRTRGEIVDNDVVIVQVAVKLNLAREIDDDIIYYARRRRFLSAIKGAFLFWKYRF